MLASWNFVYNHFS